MNYVDQGGINFHADKCETQPNNQTYKLHGFEFKVPCTCNNCQERCNYSSLDTKGHVMEGFSWLLVGIFYLVVFVLTLTIFFIKRSVTKRHPEGTSRTSSLSDDDVLYKTVIRQSDGNSNENINRNGIINQTN
jgi:hypothetical protein